MEAKEMTWKEAVKQCWQKKFSFKGRASRSEYWLGLAMVCVGMIALYFVFFLSIVAILLLAAYIGNGLDGLIDTRVYGIGVGICFILFWLVVLILLAIQCVSMTIRRLHDIGYDGLWFLIGFIPIIGTIWLMILLSRPSDTTYNPYGDIPPEGTVHAMPLKVGAKLLWKRKFSFSGRSNRCEYGLGTMALYILMDIIENVLYIMALGLSILGAISADVAYELSLIIFNPFPAVVLALFAIVVTIASVALSVRRLHDIGKSGWWWFLNLVPVVGAIIIFFWTLRPSDGDNKFGLRDYDIEELLEE